MYQLKNEAPQEFLVRALECREKIILCSLEDKSSLKYDPKLIQSLFLRTVETGLRDEPIRIKLRAFLWDENIGDEKLLLELIMAIPVKRLRDKQNLPKRNRFDTKFLVLKLIVQNFPTKVKRGVHMLQRSREKGVKLNARTCKLFKREVNCLGRILSPERYRIDPSNVKAVQELKNNVPVEDEHAASHLYTLY